MKNKIVIVSIFFACYGSVSLSMESINLGVDRGIRRRFLKNKHKRELRECIKRVACCVNCDEKSSGDEKQEGIAQVKSFAHKIIDILKKIKKNNWSKKIIFDDLVFYDFERYCEDTVLTLLAKHCCGKKNCITFLQKFYYLLNLPESDLGYKTVALRLKNGDTLFSILCKKELYAILAFFLNKGCITHLDLYCIGKRCLEQNKNLLHILLDQKLFNALKETNFGLESYDVLQQKLFAKKIENFDTIFTESFDHYVCFVDTIVNFYIQSGIKFDYEAVQNKLYQLRNKIQKILDMGIKEVETLKRNDSFVVKAYGKELRISREGCSEKMQCLELSNNKCLELIEICKDICQKLQILYYATNKEKKMYDVKILTRL